RPAPSAATLRGKSPSTSCTAPIPPAPPNARSGCSSPSSETFRNLKHSGIRLGANSGSSNTAGICLGANSGSSEGMKVLILASASPQRRAILTQLGIAFEARPAGVGERDSGPAEEVVRENALRKARTVAAAAPGEFVMGVDTVVELDGRLYGKAASPDA